MTSVPFCARGRLSTTARFARPSNTVAKFAVATKIVLLGTLLLVARPARADVFTFRFVGEVDNLVPSLTGTFALGEPVIGTYTVDSETFVATDLQLTIGGDYSLTAGRGSVHIVPGVWFLVDFTALQTTFTGAPVNGSPPAYFDIQLDDVQHVLQTGVLPLTYDISQFSNDRSNINFPDDARRLDFAVQSIELVPEPSALVLASLGCFSVGVLRVQRRICRGRKEPRR